MQVLKGPCKFIETEMTGVDPNNKKIYCPSFIQK